MATKNVKVVMKQRSDTTVNWEKQNPVLEQGEIGYDTTLDLFKIGDGSTAWKNLGYKPGKSGTGKYSEIFNGYENNIASGDYSHAEGISSKAIGGYAHAEGSNTTASGFTSHAEGSNTTASGNGSHTEGANTIASGDSSHAEGIGTISENECQHVQGRYNISGGTYAHIVGNGGDENGRSNAHTLDWSGNSWYAGNIKIGGTGYDDSTAKEVATIDNLVGKKVNNNAEIFNDYENNIASGDYSHAEGGSTTASGSQSHAEGGSTTASGSQSHAEGHATTASGGYAHAEGHATTASGMYSHSEGNITTASGKYAHAEGYATTAASGSQHVQGRLNIQDTDNKYAHIVGNGYFTDSDAVYGNAHTLDWDGNSWYAGNIKIGGTGYDDITAKEVATKSTTLSGYGIVNAYTKTEVDSKIRSINTNFVNDLVFSNINNAELYNVYNFTDMSNLDKIGGITGTVNLNNPLLSVENIMLLNELQITTGNLLAFYKGAKFSITFGSTSHTFIVSNVDVLSSHTNYVYSISFTENPLNIFTGIDGAASIEVSAITITDNKVVYDSYDNMLLGLNGWSQINITNSFTKMATQEYVDSKVSESSGSIVTCKGDELSAIESPTIGSLRFVTTPATTNTAITVGLYLYANITGTATWHKIALETTAIVSGDTISAGGSSATL